MLNRLLKIICTLNQIIHTKDPPKTQMPNKHRTVSEFLEQLQTYETKKSYKSALKLYLTYTLNKTLPKRRNLKQLDQLSLTYLTNQPDIEQDYIRFQNHLKTLYAPKTVELRMQALRSYLDTNNISLKPSFLRRVNGRKTIEPISEEKIPTQEELRHILPHLPLHIKTYALFLLCGGMRPGEPLHLTLNDIEEEPPLTKIHLKAKNTKTGRKRWTYLTPEATKYLKAWLESRPQCIQSMSESILSPSRRETFLEKYENRVFPFSYSSARKAWTSALRKAGLDMRDHHTGRLLIRLHNLIKFFSTRGKWVDRDIPDYLQGHIRGVRAVYNRYDQAEHVVREVYLKAVPSLTILELSSGGMYEERVSRVFGERMQWELIEENYSSLLGENRVLRNRLRFVEFESRLLSLELRQVQFDYSSVRDDLHVSNEKLDYVLDVISKMSN